MHIRFPGRGFCFRKILKEPPFGTASRLAEMPFLSYKLVVCSVPVRAFEHNALRRHYKRPTSGVERCWIQDRIFWIWDCRLRVFRLDLRNTCSSTELACPLVIPAGARIQNCWRTGFRIKCGMTEGLVSMPTQKDAEQNQSANLRLEILSTNI
jgi:hypothetical protein